MNIDSPVTVLLVDDDSLIRAGLGAILGSDQRICIVGEAENGHRAIELSQRLDPVVILMDIRMPQLDGLSAMESILDQKPDAKVMILTTFGDESYIDRALSGGAAGFMLKINARNRVDAALIAYRAGIVSQT
ncbi:response regulator [Glutamicibacter arilaitensis]|uniref:response regulator n=1 Tax=Glutamicibacter arilaitensis TaxID=256701 RepID=UPI003FD3DF58